MSKPWCTCFMRPISGLAFSTHCLHSDVNSMYLSSTEPPAAAEWACLLRPLRGREPEGVWNLLSIVREMFKRRDSNAAPLLEILTDQCLTYEQVTLRGWRAPLWFIFSFPYPRLPPDGDTGERHSFFLRAARCISGPSLFPDNGLVVQRAHLSLTQQRQWAHGPQQWAVRGGRPCVCQHV